MLWQSNLNSASAFTKALREDPDFVFVTRFDSRLSLTVSGASECDPNMTVVGPNSGWRVNVSKAGRRLKAVSIRMPKPRRK